MCYLAMHEAQNHWTALSDPLSHIYFPAKELNISYFAPFFPVYTTGMGHVLLSLRGLQSSSHRQPIPRHCIPPPKTNLSHSFVAVLQLRTSSPVTPLFQGVQALITSANDPTGVSLERVCRNIHALPTAQEAYVILKYLGD